MKSFKDFEDIRKNSDSMKDIELGKLLRFVLMQSKLILLIVFTVFALTVANYLLSPKIYNIKSLLQVESTQPQVFDTSNIIGLAGQQTSTEINSLVPIYKSRSNILKIIKDLNLNFKFDDESHRNLVDIELVDEIQDNMPFVFFVNANEEVINILDKDKKIIAQQEINEPVSFNGITAIFKHDNSDNNMIKISYENLDTSYDRLKNKIQVIAKDTKGSFFRQQGLLEISINTENTLLGKKIIDYANETFINYRISIETQKARKAISFINESLISLQSVVERKKENLKNFRAENKSLNVDMQIQAVIENMQSIDEAISEIDLELLNAKGIYTSSNQIYLSLQNKKEILLKQKESIIAQINKLPKEQQTFIDLFSDLEISQKLLQELESRRLGFSIIEASTIGNIRIIDNAYVDKMVSPNISTIFVFTILAGIFACIIAVVRGYNYIPITNPAELYDNDLTESVLGVLPYSDDINDINDDIRLKSSIQSLIVNMDTLAHSGAKVISITSPTPGNGKSTLSRLLSEGLSNVNGKVLLIDHDFKRGKLNRSYNKQSIKDSDFLSINEENITNFKITDSFYFIPRIRNSEASFQFLFSPSYQKVLNSLKEIFDFIVIDTAPILSVADTPIIINKSDINILVVRHSVNKINEIKQSTENFYQLGKKLDGYIYNAYAKPKSYYGYYGLYGNYNYQYYAERYLYDSYDYKNDNENN